MTGLRRMRAVLAAALCAAAACALAQDAPRLARLERAPDPEPSREQLDAAYEAALQKHRVRPNFVNYAAWKADDESLEALSMFLASHRHAPDDLAAWTTQALAADLTNFYNAAVIQKVLNNYPMADVGRVRGFFTEKAHAWHGGQVSLDEIERRALDAGGYRIHAALVSAARSGPPLRATLYSAELIEEQLDEQMRRWLSNPRLNRFEPPTRNSPLAILRLSRVFKWYEGDFLAAPGSLRGIIEMYGPPEAQEAVATGAFLVLHLGYDWSLNSAPPESAAGADEADAAP